MRFDNAVVDITVGLALASIYAATNVVEVGVAAVKTGERMTIDHIEKPALYR